MWQTHIWNQSTNNTCFLQNKMNSFFSFQSYLFCRIHKKNILLALLWSNDTQKLKYVEKNEIKRHVQFFVWGWQPLIAQSCRVFQFVWIISNFSAFDPGPFPRDLITTIWITRGHYWPADIGKYPGRVTSCKMYPAGFYLRLRWNPIKFSKIFSSCTSNQ